MILTVKQLEDLEAARLAPYATKSRNSKGRKHKEVIPENSYGRLCFQKDRDRIIHCKAFRRLDEKAQVFPAFFGDHYRTRLTHTLEVSQIARDIARRLGLNEDLSEAIALAHDLGHPPFGHTGEDALNEMMSLFGSHFEHNEQSKRVVTKLEKLYPDFDGLNLSLEVLEGLEKHKTSWDRSSVKDENFVSAHIEGQVVNLADEIAYTNHDIDDGIRSGILKISDIERTELWQEALSGLGGKNISKFGEEVMTSRIISRITGLMIVDICEYFDGDLLKFSPSISLKVKELRDVLYTKFYMSDEVRKKLLKGKKMIKKLFEYYIQHPDKVHEKYKTGEKIEVAIKDYIAGMTDQFLKSELNKNLKLR